MPSPWYQLGLKLASSVDDDDDNIHHSGRRDPGCMRSRTKQRCFFPPFLPLLAHSLTSKTWKGGQPTCLCCVSSPGFKTTPSLTSLLLLRRRRLPPPPPCASSVRNPGSSDSFPSLPSFLPPYAASSPFLHFVRRYGEMRWGALFLSPFPSMIAENWREEVGGMLFFSLSLVEEEKKGEVR